MAIESLGAVLGYLSRLFIEGTVSGLPDDQLLDRFLGDARRRRFEALVARHGPMVLSVCRAVLRNPSDAEDAFQATFLILVKKARTLRGAPTWGDGCTGSPTASRSRRTSPRPGDACRRGGRADDCRDPSPVPASRTTCCRRCTRRSPGCPRSIRLAVVLCDLQGIPQARPPSR